MNIRYHIKEIEADELNLIATALSKLPFEAVAPLIAKLRAQVQEIEAEFAAKAAPAPSAPVVTDPGNSHPETPAPAQAA